MNGNHTVSSHQRYRDTFAQAPSDVSRLQSTHTNTNVERTHFPATTQSLDKQMADAFSNLFIGNESSLFASSISFISFYLACLLISLCCHIVPMFAPVTNTHREKENCVSASRRHWQTQTQEHLDIAMKIRCCCNVLRCCRNRSSSCYSGNAISVAWMLLQFSRHWLTTCAGTEETCRYWTILFTCLIVDFVLWLDDTISFICFRFTFETVCHNICETFHTIVQNRIIIIDETTVRSATD